MSRSDYVFHPSEPYMYDAPLRPKLIKQHLVRPLDFLSMQGLTNHKTLLEICLKYMTNKYENGRRDTGNFIMISNLQTRILEITHQRLYNPALPCNKRMPSAEYASSGPLYVVHPPGMPPTNIHPINTPYSAPAVLLQADMHPAPPVPYPAHYVNA